MTLHIILPCAGKGSRLGLDIPKELYPITPERKLIDFSLDKIDDNNEHSFEITVVISPGKELVHEHVSSRFPLKKVRKVYFDHTYEEWPGSVYSGINNDFEYNLVLLPDSTFSLVSNKNLLDTAKQLLSSNPLIFGAEKTDPCATKLHTLGALKIESCGKVVSFQDKPESLASNKISLYNAFWGCYGFRTEISEELYKFLISSVKKQKPKYSAQSFFPAQSFEITNYIDFGTWGNIKAYQSNCSA